MPVTHVAVPSENNTRERGGSPEEVQSKASSSTKGGLFQRLGFRRKQQSPTIQRLSNTLT